MICAYMKGGFDYWELTSRWRYSHTSAGQVSDSLNKRAFLSWKYRELCMIETIDVIDTVTKKVKEDLYKTKEY